MSQSKSISQAFNQLARHYWLDSLSAFLSGLHRKHQEPVPPRGEFGRTPQTLPFLNPTKVGALGGYEKLAIDAYNEGVKAAYSCIDWEYLGLLCALENSAKGSADWQAYYQEAKATLSDFFASGEAFTEFEAYLLEPAKEYLGLDH